MSGKLGLVFRFLPCNRLYVCISRGNEAEKHLFSTTLGMAECSISKDDRGVSHGTVAAPLAASSLAGQRFPIKISSECLSPKFLFFAKRSRWKLYGLTVCSLHVKWQQVVFTMLCGCSQSGVTLYLSVFSFKVTFITISGSSSYSRSACIVDLTFVCRCTNGNSGVSISRESVCSESSSCSQIDIHTSSIAPHSCYNITSRWCYKTRHWD